MMKLYRSNEQTCNQNTPRVVMVSALLTSCWRLREKAASLSGP